MDKSKVVVAMSGGVDSSVAAALLVEQGYEVIGMMLKLWSEPGYENENRCCTPSAAALAKEVSGKLSIPFYMIDAKDVFHETVVKYFISGYAHGITPNPCLLCNHKIKWHFLLERARVSGADFLATGHYARLEKPHNHPIKLYQALDKEKDQSYVLGNLTQAQLSQTLFPIGQYKKNEVRGLAQKFNLPSSTTKESQDLCFLAGADYHSFLKRHVQTIENAGPIATMDGRILGEHKGLAFYTIGQRKGLGISSPEAMYVIDKNLKNNTLIVGVLDELGRDKLAASNVNWIRGEAPKKPFEATVKIRYRAPHVLALVTPIGNNSFKAGLPKPIRDITPGQAAVIYQGEEVVASGTIDHYDSK